VKHALRRTGILVLLILGGCAGPATDPGALPAPDDMQAWTERFPQNRWVRGWGESNRSAREAELDAKAQVANQVRSSITAETTSLARAVMQDDEVHDFQDLVSEVRSTTTFSRAELIRIVEPTVHEVDQVHRVLAVLDRRELARAFQMDYDDVAASWRPSFSALNAASGDLPEWTAAWNRCRDGFGRVLGVAAETRAVSGLNPAGYGSDQAMWRRANASRDSVLQYTEIVMDIGPVDGLDSRELAERLVSGFAQLGVTARTGDCRPSEASLRLTPHLSSRQVIGSVLSLELQGEIGPCGDSQSWYEVRLAGSAMRGEGRDPEGDLLRSMTPEAVALILTESLGHLLPLQGLK